MTERPLGACCVEREVVARMATLRAQSLRLVLERVLRQHKLESAQADARAAIEADGMVCRMAYLAEPEVPKGAQPGVWRTVNHVWTESEARDG